MTLTLALPPDIEARLREWAASSGRDVASVVREVIEEKLAAHPSGSSTNGNAAKPTLADLVAVMRSSPGLDDGWAGAVEQAVKLGNEPKSAGSPWDC